MQPPVVHLHQDRYSINNHNSQGVINHVDHLDGNGATLLMNHIGQNSINPSGGNGPGGGGHGPGGGGHGPGGGGNGPGPNVPPRGPPNGRGNGGGYSGGGTIDRTQSSSKSYSYTNSSNGNTFIYSTSINIVNGSPIPPPLQKGLTNQNIISKRQLISVNPPIPSYKTNITSNTPEKPLLNRNNTFDFFNTTLPQSQFGKYKRFHDDLNCRMKQMNDKSNNVCNEAKDELNFETCDKNCKLNESLYRNKNENKGMGPPPMNNQMNNQMNMNMNGPPPPIINNNNNNMNMNMNMGMTDTDCGKKRNREGVYVAKYKYSEYVIIGSNETAYCNVMNCQKKISQHRFSKRKQWLKHFYAKHKELRDCTD